MNKIFAGSILQSLCFINLARCSVAVLYMTAYRHNMQAQHSIHEKSTGTSNWKKIQAHQTGKKYRLFTPAHQTVTGIQAHHVEVETEAAEAL